MPFARPDLKTLISRAQSDLEGRLPGTDARLRRSILSAIAHMHAGGVHGLFGYLDWLAKQVIPDTAEAEFLERHASLWGIARKPASPALGPVTFSGTDGATIPAGTLLQRSDGAEYATTADAVIAGGTASAQVQAQVAGAAGNSVAGQALSLVSPVSGVQSQATVATGGLGGGADIEADDSLRARLLARLKETPAGGAAHDYEAWALAVPGVSRAWVFGGLLGAGTVSVYVVDDESTPITPAQATLDAVAAYIEERRPVTAEIHVFAPELLVVDLEINLSPNTASVQAAVTSELEALFNREAEVGGTILHSHFREAISIAAGESDHALVSPVGNIVAAAGQIPVLGVITFGAM
ncbi:baseplate J/gp47 family protein [Desulfocurvibacter africanus]|uniref:baseplate J/gp47 family protein n=1 Tax=Desulfocurvibacter africanus TaxID=873 RepID=UPI000402C596|nr:baseplate J/gp47 family protein [Desulfocurvibacter africanus]